MKCTSIFIILTVADFAAAASAFAAASAPVTGVVLYPNSATLERTVHVTPGTSQVEVTKLPANFDIQTLRVDASSGIRIGQITAKDTAQSENKDSRQAVIEEKILALQDQQTALDNEIKSAELVRTFLGRLGSGDSASPRPPMDGKSLSGLTDAMRRESGEALSRIQRATVQKRELAKMIDALNRDLRRIKSEGVDLRDIAIQVDAQKAGRLILSYQVSNAGWRPTYRASLDSLSSKVQVERRGTLFQKTGEDWRGVKVKLSTGYPNSSPQAADPQPWRITYRPHEEQTVTVTGIRAAPQSVVRRNHDSVVDAVFAEDVGKMPDKNVAESLQRITSTYTSEFEAPAPVNLPADGREISVKLSDDTVAVAQKIRVAPRLNTAAVVTAEAPRMEGAWVPGDIQLFRDGSYVGESHWNPQSSQGFVFSFGTDDLVRVKVVQGKDRSGTTGLLSKQAERTASATYSISSAHKTPVDLLVLESSPVSASDAITVETTFTPQPTQKEWSDKPGVMAWEKKLAPGETFKLNVDYSVTYPREGTTIGLP